MRKRRMPRSTFGTRIPKAAWPRRRGDPPIPDEFSSAKVELALGDEWCLYGEFFQTDAGPVLAEIRIFPADAKDDSGREYSFGQWFGSGSRVARLSHGITARLLRSVSITALETELRNAITREHLEVPRAFKRTDREKVLPRRTGRAGRGDRFYAEWASRYANQLARGNDKPIATLAEQYDLHQYQVRDLVRRARERGLLTRGSQGKPGGELTEKGQAALINKEK